MEVFHCYTLLEFPFALSHLFSKTSIFSLCFARLWKAADAVVSQNANASEVVRKASVILTYILQWLPASPGALRSTFRFLYQLNGVIYFCFKL